MSKIDWKMLSSSSNAANTSTHISTQIINFEEGHRQVKDPPPGTKVSNCPPSLWGVISSAIILLIFKNSWNLHVSAYFSCFVTGELDRLHIIPAAFTHVSPKTYCFDDYHHLTRTALEQKYNLLKALPVHPNPLKRCTVCSDFVISPQLNALRIMFFIFFYWFSPNISPLCLTTEADSRAHLQTGCLKTTIPMWNNSQPG